MPDTIVVDCVIPMDKPLVFGSENPNWTNETTYNILFLRAQQNYLNDLYYKRGHLFLNDVYDSLGFARTQAGAVLGWVFGESSTVTIDWRITDHNRFILEFDPLGVIIDQI